MVTTLFPIPEPFVDLVCLKAELYRQLVYDSVAWYITIVSFVYFTKSFLLVL